MKLNIIMLSIILLICGFGIFFFLAVTEDPRYNSDYIIAAFLCVGSVVVITYFSFQGEKPKKQAKPKKQRKAKKQVKPKKQAKPKKQRATKKEDKPDETTKIAPYLEKKPIEPTIYKETNNPSKEQVKQEYEKFLDIKEVTEMVSLSKTKIYDMMKEGTFPERRKIQGTSNVRWYKSEIQEWIKKNKK